MSKNSKQRREMSDDEKIKITLHRVAKLKEFGTWPPNAEVAKLFKRNPGMISRAFTASLRDGLVELTIPPRPRKLPQRDVYLETALRQQFPKLLGAVVVK